MVARDILLPPLLDAAAVALREMADVASAPRDGELSAPADLFAVLWLHEGVTGRLVLAFPLATAEALARRVLRDADADASPDAALVRDCAGELANVVAGLAKAALSGTPHHFTFSLPRVTGDPGPGPGGGAAAAVVETDAGPFAVRVELEGAP